jgi:hypothetical protein
MVYLKGIPRRQIHDNIYLKFYDILSVENAILESIFMINQNKTQPLELKVDNLFFLGSSFLSLLDHNKIKYNIIFAIKVKVKLNHYYSNNYFNY